MPSTSQISSAAAQFEVVRSLESAAKSVTECSICHCDLGWFVATSYNVHWGRLVSERDAPDAVRLLFQVVFDELISDHFVVEVAAVEGYCLVYGV